MTVSPEALRWLHTPVPAESRVAVAGVAGGVGTTTVAALLWWALRERYGVSLLDHGGGTLAARLPADPPPPTPDLLLHDVGPFALARAALLEQPQQVLVVVCGASALPAGAEAVATLTRGPDDARARSVVVPVAVSGRAPGARHLLHQATELGLHSAVVPIGPHRALAAGSDVPGPRVSRDADRAHRAGAAVAAEVVRCARALRMGRSTHAGAPPTAWS